MRCSHCGHDNKAGAKFCNECGGKLEPFCSACSTVNAPGSKFCNECGARLTEGSTAKRGNGETEKSASVPPPPVSYTPKHLAERIRAEQAALEARGAQDGERKIITVLFADIKGSTALIEDLDPEEAQALIDFKPLGAAQIKGMSEPLQIYEVLGIGPLRTKLQVAARRGLARFIGRLREMEALQNTLTQASQKSLKTPIPST